jgi:hypothetical protein
MIILCGLFATLAHASLSRAMQFQCKNIPEYKKGDLNADDQWIADKIKGFIPESGAASLRLLSMTQDAPEVALAIQEIRSTCHDYRAGKIEEYAADSRLSGYEEIIQSFEEKLSREAESLAATGDVTKISVIRGIMTRVATAGRQNALLGEDMLADAARNIMLRTVDNFDTAFSQKCKGQSFDRDIALALERQRVVLGLGEQDNVMHCAYRHAEAKWSSGINDITWKHCGIIVGTGKVKITGLFVGNGEGSLGPDSTGDYSAHFTKFGKSSSDLKETGTMNFHCVQSVACDCLQHPAKDECKGVDTSQIKNELSIKGNSFTGTIYYPAPIGPRAPDDPELARKGILGQDYPVTFKKEDHPCDPDEEESKK